MQLPLTVNLDIQAFSGSGITDYNSGLTNCVVSKKDDRLVVTQRTPINITEDASGLGLNNRARGLYYWETNAKLYIVHDNDLYESTQNSTRIAENTGTFSSGSERVTMLESAGTARLIILDAENNKGWVMNAAKTLDQIVSNFPSTLVHGGAILDTYLFVMDEDGIIYNSDSLDPTTFGALSFLNTERDNDKGVYLGKHHDHIVAFGTRTIEFFYDAGNAIGSPLNRRTDLSYNIGCLSGTAVWENGDVIYFIGSSAAGQPAVYKLENFQVSIISKDVICAYITSAMLISGLKAVCSGLTTMGRDVLQITFYSLSSGNIVPAETISYDAISQMWGFWRTDLNSHSKFPLITWTRRTGGQNATTAARTGEGIFYNGDIITVKETLIPVDSALGTEGVYASGVYDIDVYSASTDDAGVNIPMKIRTGTQSFGTGKYKFQTKESVDVESTEASQTLRIRHSDGKSNDFNTGRTIDLSSNRKELYQGGRFIRRNYQLEYSGNEQIYINGFELEIGLGT